jgi:hypothetical protein
VGIEFIKSYVNTAYIENKFCNYFSAEDIHNLLRSYAKNYQELLLNIYEQILTAALGCIIAGVDCSRLNITPPGVQNLCDTFTDKSKTEILAIISKAANELNKRYQFSPELDRYIMNSLPLIASNIDVARRAGVLKKLFVTPSTSID